LHLQDYILCVCVRVCYCIRTGFCRVFGLPTDLLRWRRERPCLTC
jgi:hypothetical protein